ncbi:MAG: hypothetical protein ACOCV1_00695 [Bacillota bacterium]
MRRSKSFRRNQEERIKQKSRRICKTIYNYQDKNLDEKIKYYDKIKDNITICSCWMCGNPRRNKGSKKDRLTKQELLAYLKQKEQEI